MEDKKEIGPKKMGPERRLRNLAAAAGFAASALFGAIKPAEARPMNPSEPDRAGLPTLVIPEIGGKELELSQSSELIGAPMGTPTEAENKMWKGLFPDVKDKEYAGIITNPTVEKDGRVNLFEKGSKLDQKVQTLAGVVTQAGGKAELVVAVDTTQNLMSPILRLTGDIKLKTQSGEVNFPKGSVFLDYQGKLSYLKPVEPEEDKSPWVLGHIKVTPKLKEDIQKRQLSDGRRLSVEPRAVWLIGQSSQKDGTIADLISADLAINLVPVKGGVQATPVPGATSEPITTEVPVEVFAKVVESDTAKGMEYWSSLSQEQLATIEKSASFRFKDFKTFKELSLSYLTFERGRVAVKDSFEAYVFPILLEKPSLEKMQITSISTNKPKDIEVYTAPVLLKTSQGKYVVTKIFFRSFVSSELIVKDTNSDGFVGGSPKQNVKTMPIVDLMSKMKPGEQYGFEFLVLNTPGSEKKFMSDAKNSLGSRWNDKYAEELDTFASLMALYDKNVRGLGPFSSQPGVIRNVLGPLTPASLVMVGPQWR